MRRTGWILGILLAAAASETRAAPPEAAISPDGRVRIEVALRKTGDTNAVPHYRVTFGEAEVIGYSRLGVELEGGGALGGPCEMQPRSSNCKTKCCPLWTRR